MSHVNPKEYGSPDIIYIPGTNTNGSPGISAKQFGLYATYTVLSPIVALIRFAIELIFAPKTIYHAIQASRYEKKLYEGNGAESNTNRAEYLYHKTEVVETLYSLKNAALEVLPIVGPLILLGIMNYQHRHGGNYVLKELNGEGNVENRSYPSELDLADLYAQSKNNNNRKAEDKLKQIRKERGESYKEPEMGFFTHLNHFSQERHVNL